MSDAKEIEAALKAPFPTEQVQWVTVATKANRALVAPYIRVPAITDRLDEVVGVDGWQDRYECVRELSVICTLSLKIGEQWVSKSDAGGPSAGEGDEDLEGDRLKSAFTDALKRAALRWGIGRYLKNIPRQWVDYDSTKKTPLQTPALPGSAPKAKHAPKSNGGKGTPRNATELDSRLRAAEADLVKDGVCQPGDLVKDVMRQFGPKYKGPIESWPPEAIPEAVKFAADWINDAKR